MAISRSFYFVIECRDDDQLQKPQIMDVEEYEFLDDLFDYDDSSSYSTCSSSSFDDFDDISNNDDSSVESELDDFNFDSKWLETLSRAVEKGSFGRIENFEEFDLARGERILPVFNDDEDDTDSIDLNARRVTRRYGRRRRRRGNRVESAPFCD